MARHLIIVESPAKAKTIGKILGSTFDVKSSVGHIRDLPDRTLGVDIENGFAPKYVLSKNKTKVVNELRKAAKACDSVYLAPDPDREGESIAWHLQEVLAASAKDKPFYRVQYNEITPRAVRAAIENPGTINMNRVDAQQARRVLDRIVGYMVSPLLWRQVRRGLSAGRVQSVALRLVCEREQAIRAFVSESYWVLGARVRKETASADPFTIKLARMDGEKADIRAESAAAAALSDLEGRRLRVGDIRTRPVTRRAMPPFTTSTLQQAASSVCGFSPSRTMGLAQKLYEGVELGAGDGIVGLITYMRTDSVAISRDAQAAARDFIVSEYGDAYYPDTPNGFKSRAGAQEAHEAIRPTDVTRTPQSLKGVLDTPSLRLYDLIWRRFLASQMACARIEQRTAVVVSEPPPAQQHRYELTASASEVLFPGFLKVMELDIRKTREAEGDEAEVADEVDKLPPLVIGETLDLIEWLSDRKETKPPARFTEAALVKALEANGVGRPSTYASIIETLDARTYVSREKRMLVPSSLGMQVNDLLVAKLGDLFDVGFTASMEESLDQIENGGVQWTEMMGAFYTRFSAWMANAKEPPADAQKVRDVFNLLAQVRVWGPEVKLGKRKYSDENFVASVRKQDAEGEKPVSDKQLEALARIAVRYRDQIPGGEGELARLGFERLVASDIAAPSHAESARRFELLQAVELSDEQRRFVESLRDQTRVGRKLTDNQLAALNRIIIRNAAQIPDFDAIKETLNVAAADAVVEVDTESGPLLEMMAAVTVWREPTQRGKMTFDDHSFYESLAKQYGFKKVLSPRQRAALKKLVARYHEQIPGFAEAAGRLGLQIRAAAPAKE